MIPYINNRPQNPRLIQYLKNILHYLESLVAAMIFRYPKNKITVVGVTGTDGKTTTVNLIHHILTTAGLKTGVISTLSSAHSSSPGRGKLQYFMWQCYKNKCTHVVLEVTSIGADQHRASFINFAVGVLTNISNNEHLDYHKSFENYQAAKMKFLLNCPIIVANADDQSFKFLADKVTTQKLTSYAVKQKADIEARKISYQPSGSSFETKGSLYQTKLIGEFNIHNCLAAIAAAKELGIDDETIKKALKTFERPSGRMEVVVSEPFTIMVDFAHTPQAFEKILPVAKSLTKNNGKLIHVFGTTGSRDKSKRPMMASVAAKFDDQIILTHEDTYLEDPKKIIATLEKSLIEIGFSKYKSVFDRKEAIESAINMAKKGDVIIITGVGHQKSLNIGGKEVPWSDQKAASEIFAARKS